MEERSNKFDELTLIRERREQLEAELAQYDERVYDLESIYLKHSIALGGSLFDGFGIELSLFTFNGLSVVNNLSANTELDSKQHLEQLIEEEQKKSTNVVKVEEQKTVNEGIASTLKSANMDDSTDICSNSLPSPVQSDLYTRNANKSTATVFSSNINPLSVYEKNKCHSFAARISNFCPTERIFFTSSTGAIGRVERIKALRKLNYKNCAEDTKHRKRYTSIDDDKIDNLSSNFTNVTEYNEKSMTDVNSVNVKKSRANLKEDDGILLNVKRERSHDALDEVAFDDNIENKIVSNRKTRRRDS